ncbi:MAG: PLP-dependent transferase [Phycisphaerae bacterium]|nr:PLP-dependent transferase [Phycisphaerae bacterium]
MNKDSNVSRRTFLRTSAIAATAGLATTGLAAEKTKGAKGAKKTPDTLLTPTYKSYSGRDVTSDAVHAGEDSGSSSYPIYQGTTNHGAYTRGSNPTINSVEVKIKRLEGAEFGVATACGMAAISQTLLTFLKPGSRLVLNRNVYIGAEMLIDGPLKRLGIEFQRINMANLDELRRALKKKTDIVYFEVQSNPALDVVDVKAAAALAHAAGAMVIVDNTWLTPYLLQPLALGADIVLHSATKYMMGHGNGLCGIVCGPKKLLKRVESNRNIFGGIMAPMNAFLLHQGLKTLPMRMERHCANAMRVAEFLETHSMVKKVHYPGLASDPGHAAARKQVRGFGGMIGLEMNRGAQLVRRVKFCRPWTSLGDVETLVTHYTGNAAWGIPANYVRMSVGIEDPDDIIADLKQALAKR